MGVCPMTAVFREEIQANLESTSRKLKIAMEALDKLSTLRPMKDAERYRIANTAVLECNVVGLEKSQPQDHTREARQ
jgi:hypothetical protein